MSKYANAQAIADYIRGQLAPQFEGFTFRVVASENDSGYWRDKSRVYVYFWSVPAGSSELDKDNAKRVVMVTMAPAKSAPWMKGEAPPEEMTAETTGPSRPRSLLMRARTGPTDKVVDYVVKWFTDHASELKGLAEPATARPKQPTPRPPKSAPPASQAAAEQAPPEEPPAPEVPSWARRWGGFRASDEEAANRYTHFPRELGRMNAGLRESMVAVEAPAREKLLRWKVIPSMDAPLPDDVDAALSRYHGSLIHRQREDSRAAMIAPPWTVTGRSGYKGRPDKANKVMDNAQEVVDKALLHLQKVLRQYDPNRPIKAGEQGALERLKEKIEILESSHDVMVAANKILRSKKDPDTMLSELVELGIGEPRARKLFQPDFAGRIGFPAYEVSGALAEINRLKTRLSSLEAVKGRESVEFPFEGGVVIEDTDKMRLQIHHDTKPAKEIIKKLSESGFHWSKREMAWQRTLTEAARQAARAIVGNYDAGAPERPLHVAPTEKSSTQQAAETKLEAGRQAVIDYMSETPGFDLGSMTPEQAAEMLRRMFRARGGFRERKSDDSFVGSDRIFTFIPAENKLRVTVQMKVYGKVKDEKTADRDLVQEARKFAERSIAAASGAPQSGLAPGIERIEAQYLKRGDLVDLNDAMFVIVSANVIAEKTSSLEYLPANPDGTFDMGGRVIQKRVPRGLLVTVHRRGLFDEIDRKWAEQTQPPESAATHKRSIDVYVKGLRVGRYADEGGIRYEIPVFGPRSWLAFVDRKQLLKLLQVVREDNRRTGRPSTRVTLTRGLPGTVSLNENVSDRWQEMSAQIIGQGQNPFATGDIPTPKDLDVWIDIARNSPQPIVRIEVLDTGLAELYDDAIDFAAQGAAPPSVHPTESNVPANLDSYLSTLAPMEAGKARQTLTRLWKLGDMPSRPLYEHVEQALESGGKAGIVDTGAYLIRGVGDHAVTFDKLPRTTYDYAEHIRPSIERFRERMQAGARPDIDALMQRVKTDPDYSVYDVLATADSLPKLKEMAHYIREMFPIREVDVREAVESLIEERGWSDARPTGKLLITNDNALAELSKIEGLGWLRRQQDDRDTLSNPRGFFANMAAFKALQETKAEVGEAAKDLLVWDLIPDAGFIEGQEGRVYTVLPDGNIALNADTATPEKRAEAAKIMIVA